MSFFELLHHFLVPPSDEHVVDLKAEDCEGVIAAILVTVWV